MKECGGQRRGEERSGANLLLEDGPEAHEPDADGDEEAGAGGRVSGKRRRER